MEIIISKETNKILWIPTIILGSGNSLGPTGLRKAVILTVILYCKERTESKISRGKRQKGRKSRETRYKLPGVPSPWSCMGCTQLSHQWCGTTHLKCRQPGKLT